MKFEIRLTSNELEKVESIFAPVSEFIKENSSKDFEGPEEAFNTIRRNTEAGYAAKHKAYDIVLNKDGEDYVISCSIKEIFMEIASEFGNKLMKMFINIAKPIIELSRDKIISRFSELNDDTDEQRMAIVGGQKVPYTNAWRSSQAIEHDKAVMFDVSMYAETHEISEVFNYLVSIMNKESDTVRYNKDFFIKLYEELEGKCDDEVLKDLCKRAIDRLA